MKLSFHQEIGARFKLVVRKADGRVARETGWFKNLVLDTGLARMSVGTWIDRCCVGTGNSTPVATQVQLDSFVASTTTQQATSTVVQITTAPFYYSATITWRFAQGVAAGNISEVGLGWGNSDLWNRALIKDANGDPTTITVLSDEYLDVVSEVRVYPVQSLSGSFNLLDKTGAVISTHTYTGIPSLSGGASVVFNKVYLGWGDNNTWYPAVYSGNIGTITTEPSAKLGNGYPAITYPTATSCRCVATFDLNTANGTHKSLSVPVYNLCSAGLTGYQLQISPTITKTSSQIMTYTFELSWGRYTG